MPSKSFIKSLLIGSLLLTAPGCGNLTEEITTGDDISYASGKGDSSKSSTSSLFQKAKENIHFDLTFSDKGRALITVTNTNKFEVQYRGNEPFALEKFNDQTQQWEEVAVDEGDDQAFIIPSALRYDKFQVNKSGRYRAVLLIGFQCDEFLSIGDCLQDDLIYSNETTYVTQAEKNENNIQMVKDNIQMYLTIKNNGQANVSIWNDNKVRVDFRASEPVYLERYNPQKQDWEIEVRMEGSSQASALPARLKVEQGLNVTKEGLYRAVMIVGLQCDEFLSIGDCVADELVISDNYYFGK